MQDTRDLEQRVQELMSLLEAFKQLNSNIEIEDVFQNILLQMVNVLDAEAGTLWVLDQTQGVIKAVAAHGESASKILHFEMAAGEGIVGHVIASGVEQLIGEASENPYWAKWVDSSSGFVTKSMITVPLAAKGNVLGALQLLNKNGSGQFSEQDMRIALALASQSALALHNSQMFDEVSRMLLSMIRTLAKLLDARDPYTAGHSERVAQYALAIAKRTGMDAWECEELYKAALLHDIGKIGIVDEVLQKRSKLTAEEYETIKQHTVIGAGILSNMEPKAAMVKAVATARSHHERLDGSGYPDALKGEDIPLFARIVGVADAFDAMTTTRSYSVGMPLKEAAKELVRCKDRLFDARLVDAFIEILEESDYQAAEGFGENKTGYVL